MVAFTALPAQEKLQVGPDSHVKLLGPPSIAACMKDGMDVVIPC